LFSFGEKNIQRKYIIFRVERENNINLIQGETVNGYIIIL